MKKIIFCILLFLFFASSLFAIDEDTYVKFVADSIITAHRVKGSANSEMLWANEMRRLYPNVASQDIVSFETVLAQNENLKSAVYNKILGNVRAKGYNAHISGTGAGTTVKIED